MLNPCLCINVITPVQQNREKFIITTEIKRFTAFALLNSQVVSVRDNKQSQLEDRKIGILANIAVEVFSGMASDL